MTERAAGWWVVYASRWRISCNPVEIYRQIGPQGSHCTVSASWTSTKTSTRVTYCFTVCFNRNKAMHWNKTKHWITLQSESWSCFSMLSLFAPWYVCFLLFLFEHIPTLLDTRAVSSVIAHFMTCVSFLCVWTCSGVTLYWMLWNLTAECILSFVKQSKTFNL